MDSQEWDGHETADPGAHDCAERIARIGAADAPANQLWAVRHDLADQRKGRAHTERRGKDHDERLQKGEDRKSTRLNSSHDQISYAVFCLKKKNSTAAMLSWIYIP